MIRIVLFLLLIALAAAGAAWVADQPGDVALSWGGTKLTTTLPVFALGIAIIVVAAMIVLGMLGALWRTPSRLRRRRHERRHARGRHAITHGLLAIGHCDSTAARQHAEDLPARECQAPVKERVGVLFTCAGRGSNLFPGPDHDAGLLAEMLGQPPVAGFFCDGELGPVGGQNFLHTFTASIALFPDEAG